MNRMTRALLAAVAAIAVVLAPTAADASDGNVALALNGTDGAAVAEASVQYRVAANGVVDEENRAYAGARCSDCQTFAAAFQIVLITRDYDTFVPYNEAYAVNLVCEECLTWASAKQVLVATGGPASLTGAGRQRMRALEERLEALEADLPVMALDELVAEVDAAFAELLDIAATEVVRHDGGPYDTEVVGTRSA